MQGYGRCERINVPEPTVLPRQSVPKSARPLLLRDSFFSPPDQGQTLDPPRVHVQLVEIKLRFGKIEKN